MKHFTFLKLLLMALMLVGGVNCAWGDDVTIGEADNSTAWWSAFSEYYTLAPNKTLTVSFTNYSGKSEYYHNFVAAITTDADRNGDGYSEHLILRADNYGWGNSYSSGTLTSNYNWDTFKDDMDGAEIILKVERKGAQITVNADITASDGETKYYENFVFNCGAGTQTIRAFLTTEKGHIVIHSADIDDTEGSTFATVKMTWVDYDNPDTSAGEIAAGSTAKTGYNKISAGSVGFAHTEWNCNWITYLQVDASLPDGATITSATLSFDQSGSTDSKRPTTVGAGYNSSTWSSTMTYNTADKTITTIGSTVSTTTNASGTFESKTIDITSAFKGDDDNVVTILLYETAAAGCYVKNPAVNVTYTTAAAASYTIQYVANISGLNTEIKASRSEVGIVGDVATIASSDKDVIWYNSVKYLYDSDNASSTTIKGDNSSVVTVTYVEAPSYTYSVTDNLGNNLASGSAYQGENVTFWVPYYVYNAGRFYQSPSLSSGSLSYGQGTISGISANTAITVTYTEEENTNVVFYSEAENLTGVTAFNDSFTKIRMSNGQTGYYTSSTAFANLSAGVYTLTSSTRQGSTTFYAGTVGEGEKVMDLSSSGTVVTTTSDPFTLTEASDIYTSVGSTNAYFDYVIIRIQKKAVTIGDAGWATLYTPYALDFSSLSSSFKAYTATVDGTTVTLTEVSNVPANTGVVLNGAAGSYNIPVITSSVTAQGSLTGNASATTNFNEFAGYDLYMLALNAQNKAQFTKVTSGSIAAGKAFLKLPTGVGVKSFNVVFNDIATGVDEIAGSKFQVSGTAIYNVAGQRVSQPTRGLYIKNGKKIIIK